MRVIHDQDLLTHATRTGDYLDGKLRALAARYPIITDVRGLGLMRAFDLSEPRAQDIMDRALERGVLITNAGPSTIRFVPPLIITNADIDEAVEVLDQSLATM